jgi:chromosome segregation ATPase
MANWRQKNTPETAMERLTNIARSNRVASAPSAFSEDAMLKPLEQRVEDLEDIVADIPALVNLRLENMISNQQEANDRIALLDRQIATLTRDVRDLRGGVTRQLKAQDVEIAEVKATVMDVNIRLTRVEADVAALKADVAVLKTAVAALTTAVAALTTDVASLNTGIATVQVGIDEILARLPKQ